MMTTPTLLSAALLLLLLLPRAPADRSGETTITIKVTNSVTNAPNQTYCTTVAFRGILLGAMRRLQNAKTGFKFKYTENADYGPFLESVNGLAGRETDRTYWELLAKTTDNEIIRPNVGIGCYIPNPNEEIILNFNTY